MLLFESSPLLGGEFPGAQEEGAERVPQFGYQNLLQELLLALVGFASDVFDVVQQPGALPTPVPNPDRCNMSVSNDLAWVEAPDRALINELLRLGYHYRAIDNFVQSERSSTQGSMLPGTAATAAAAAIVMGGSGSASMPHAASVPAAGALTPVLGGAGSMYRQALAAGLAEALHVYQQAVQAVHLQLQDPLCRVTLPHLHHQLHDYKVLLAQLHHLVYRVSGSDTTRLLATSLDPTAGPATALGVASCRAAADSWGTRVALVVEPLGGAAVLALLNEQARSGLPALQSTVARLLWHCNQTLFKQLTSWMVYGHLLDPHDEFFVRRAQHGPLPTSNVPMASSGSQQQQQQQHSQAQKQQQQGGGAGDFDFVSTFEVALGRLPPYVSVEAAQAVLFVGKAVRLLSQPAGEFRGRQLLSHQDTLKAAQMMQELQASAAFDRVAFEKCVDALRTKVAAVLWQLVVQQAGLMTHLLAIKDYFLLAKGEFAHAFLVEARRLLALPPRPRSADADVVAPWQRAALQSSAQHDALFPCFRVHWASSGPEHQSSLPPQARLPRAAEVPRFDPNWDGLWLEACVDWPLGLLLTPTVMSRYNALFQLLLRLKRVQLSLEGAWVVLGELSAQDDAVRRDARLRSAHGAGRGRDPLLVDLQQLRHHMTHLVVNLQIYIQVDVVETNYAQLEQRVAAAQDYSEVERAHASYLHALMAQCFLTTHTMSRTITSIFRHVADLCRLVDSVHSSNLMASLPSATAQQQTQLCQDRAQAQQRLGEVSAGFKQLMMEVYTVLHSSKLLDANKAPHLRQLYMRLNYNEFLGSNMVVGRLSGGG